MPGHTHRLVAYTVGRLANPEHTSCSVYDYACDRRVSISGIVDPQSVLLFDHEIGAHFGGCGDAGEFSLSHEGSGVRVTLKVEPDGRFTGFDYSTGCYFRGNVFGTSITLYNVCEDRYYSFST